MAPKRNARKNSKGKLIERALGPAADSFGRQIAPLGKEAGAVANQVGRLLLETVSGVVYGIEHISSWVRDAVSKRLVDLRTEDIQQPNARIAVPAIQALVYSMHEEEIREMFINLLASDMHPDKKSCVHPSFVQIIKEMSPLEGVILSNWRKLGFSHDGVIEYQKKSHPGSWEYALEGEQDEEALEHEKWDFATARISSTFRLADEHKHDREFDKFFSGLRNHNPSSWQVQAAVANLVRLGLLQLYFEASAQRLSKARIALHLTPLGKDFLEVCVTEEKKDV
jgi:hypothetical protein